MTRVKICGITNGPDARVAAIAGVDLLGFIFYKPSPRYVTPATVRDIVGQYFADQPERPVLVGVFVDEALAQVRHVLAYCGLDGAQLHGSEPPQMVAALAGQGYKAIRPRLPADVWQAIDTYRVSSSSSASPLPAFLLDAYHPTLYGGTGRVTDWSLAAEVAGQHNILLAGSLTPQNVAEAVRVVRPWGVDVSSGVEAERGRKDHAKVRHFIQQAKG
jgi:phosphoribosylanthranilate isomerase